LQHAVYEPFSSLQLPHQVVGIIMKFSVAVSSGDDCWLSRCTPLVMIVGCPDGLDNPGLRLVLVILLLGWSW